jgi:hypothetical protein
MNLTLTFSHFKELTKAGYTLDMLCFITLVEEGNDVDEMCAEDSKMKMLYQTVRRKGLLSESNKITIIGNEVLSFLNEKIEQPKIAKKKYPFLIDTNIYCKHIEKDGRQFPLEFPPEFLPLDGRPAKEIQ